MRHRSQGPQRPPVIPTIRVRTRHCIAASDEAPEASPVPVVTRPAGMTGSVRATAHLAACPPLNAIWGLPALSGLKIRQEAVSSPRSVFPSWPRGGGGGGGLAQSQVSCRRGLAQPRPASPDPGLGARGAPASWCWWWVRPSLAPVEGRCSAYSSSYDGGEVAGSGTRFQRIFKEVVDF